MGRLFTRATVLTMTLGCLVACPDARADAGPRSDERNVDSWILVEGQLPAGKALLVAPGWSGARPLPVNDLFPSPWHPVTGDLRIYLVDEDAAATVTEGGTNRAFGRQLAVAQGGIPCTEPFAGERTALEDQGYDDIRRVFALEATATTCSARLVRVEKRLYDIPVVYVPAVRVGGGMALIGALLLVVRRIALRRRATK